MDGSPKVPLAKRAAKKAKRAKAKVVERHGEQDEGRTLRRKVNATLAKTRKWTNSLEEPESTNPSKPQAVSLGGFGLCALGCSSHGNWTVFRAETVTLDSGAEVSAAPTSMRASHHLKS